MDRELIIERDRLITAASHRVDEERRAWRFVLLFVSAFVGAALSTIVPGHETLWGTTTAAQSFVSFGAAIGSLLLSAIVYRRFGGSSRVYTIAEAFEVFVLTGQPAAFAYTAGDGVLIFWLVYLPGPLFWAQVKPARWRSYGAISLGAMLLSAAACWRDGRTNTALLAVLVGVAAAVVVAWVARSRLRTFTIEAERNITEHELSALRLEEERRALTREVETDLGEDLRRLAVDLERFEPTRGEAVRAREIANELERLGLAEAPCSSAALAERIEQKCRPLCAKIHYEQATRIDASRKLAAGTTTALTRIAQELVRNAATHSGAKQVSLDLVVDATATTLAVRDDGAGLSPETLARSHGGLDNAARRLEELGGTLALTPTAPGTELVARVPH